MSTIAERYAPGNPCPVCETDSKGCDRTHDGLQFCRGEPARPDEWVCMFPRRGEWAGYRHINDPELSRNRGGRRTGRRKWNPRRDSSGPVKPKKPEAKTPDAKWARLAEEYARVLREENYLHTTHPGGLRGELAEDLGLPVHVFDRLPAPGLGYISNRIEGAPNYRECAYDKNGNFVNDNGQWVFIETDAAGTPTAPLRRWRKGGSPDGKDKKRILGGHAGIILPTGWREILGASFLVEGATDVLAMIAAGLSATARPSNRGGEELLAEAYRDWPADRDIVVVPENDERPHPTKPGETLWPGRDGGYEVAQNLANLLRRPVKVAFPPDGFKDVRAWLTAPERAEVPWEERGRVLAAAMLATAVTVEPAAEAATAGPSAGPSASPVATQDTDDHDSEPDPNDPYAAGREVRDGLTGSLCPRPYWGNLNRPRTGEWATCPFRCNSPKCFECRRSRKLDRFTRDESFVIRRTGEDGGDGEDVLVARLVPKAEREAACEVIYERGGIYRWVDTTDPDCCREALGLASDNVADHGPELSTSDPAPGEAHCTKLRPHACAPLSDVHTLVFGLLPAGTDIPDGFACVNCASGLRAMGVALATPPKRVDGIKRQRLWGGSPAWGDKPEKKHDCRFTGRTLYGGRFTRELSEHLEIGTDFFTRDPRIQGKCSGWSATTPAHDAVIDLLIRGAGVTDTEETPTKERIRQLATDWFAALDGLDLQAGARVRAVLMSKLWTESPLLNPESIAEELRRANDEDISAAEAVAEIGPMVKAAIDATLEEPWVGRLITRGNELVRLGVRVRVAQRLALEAAADRFDEDHLFLASIKGDVLGRLRRILARAVRRQPRLLATPAVPSRPPASSDPPTVAH